MFSIHHQANQPQPGSKEPCICLHEPHGGGLACFVVTGPLCGCWVTGADGCLIPLFHQAGLNFTLIAGSSKLWAPHGHGPTLQGTGVHLAVMFPNSKATASCPRCMAGGRLPLSLLEPTNLHMLLNFHEATQAVLSPALFNLRRPLLFLDTERVPSSCAFLCPRTDCGVSLVSKVHLKFLKACCLVCGRLPSVQVPDLTPSFRGPG